MATPMGPSTFVKVLRDAGLKVVEEPGWRTNNRNHKGAWGPVHGVMLHHTVTEGVTQKDTDDTVDLCFRGHSTLPGPLCHGVIAKDGTVYLVGNGRANHAGLGDDDVLKAVIAEKALPPDNEANTDGNRYFYGFECINLGDGRDSWPRAQVDAMIKASAAICKHHGWGPRSVIGHLEWQPGKIDPRGPGWPGMDAARVRIGTQLGPAPKPPAPKPPTPPKETDTMRLTQLTRDEALTIPAGEERNVYFNAPDVRDDPNEHGAGGFTFLSSAAVYTGTVAVWTPAESSIGVKVVQLLADGDTTSTSSTATLQNTEPVVRSMAAPVAGFLPGGGRKLFVRLYNYGTTAVSVSRVDLRLLSSAE